MSLRYLFVDMNSYFASVEQQDRPELRGRPVAVVAVEAETTSCIAASYEAKKFGVRTGTPVYEARRLCPGLRLVTARTDRYVEMHHQVVAAVDSCLPVLAVLSIDEMVCRLAPVTRTVDAAQKLALQVKAAICQQAGEWMRCSVGLAPNRFLAKVAGDMQKPDGLTTIVREELPERLYSLKLIDFPGIGRKMEERLRKWGITEVRQLCQLDIAQLSQIWNSKLMAEMWWGRLRGEDHQEKASRHGSVGHSNVLAPELRNAARSSEVLFRLVDKAAARLRRTRYWAGLVTVQIEFVGGGHWDSSLRVAHCQDTLTLLQSASTIWEGRPEGVPLKVGVVFNNLRHDRNVAPSLFDSDRRRVALSEAMDQINGREDTNGIYFGITHGVRKKAPPRIAFNHIPDMSPADLK